MTPSTDGAERPLRFRLFGGPGLTRGDAEVALSPMQLALLGLVYGHDDGRVARARIAWLLWEADDDARARHRISQLLHAIAKRLGGVHAVVAVGDDLCPADGAIVSELADFHASLEACDYEKCLRLMRRTFLNGQARACGDAYVDWAQDRHRSLRGRVRDAAARSLTAADASCAWADARRAAEALFRLDPDNEQFLRAVMRARILDGAPEEAEAAVQTFREALGHPSDGPLHLSTERLRCLAAEEADGATVEARAAHGPFLGRAAELAAVKGMAASIASGPITLALLSGEPGIGKTRFVEEASSLLSIEGLHVLRASCGEFERNIPLTPLLDALRQAPDAASAIAGLAEPWRGVLTSLAPELGGGREKDTVAAVAHPDGSAYRLNEAIRLFLQAQAHARPTALIIDDCQWIDDTSLSAIQFIMRRWEPAPLLLLLAFRSDEALSTQPMAGFLAEATRLCDLSLDLPRLSEDDAMSLVRALTPPDTPASVQRKIVALTGCNPFFTTELSIEYSRSPPTPPAQGALSLPASVRELVLSRTRRVSPVGQEILDLVSVASAVSRSEASALLKLPMEAVIGAVRELTDAQLVRPSARIVIKHELVRQTVVMALDPDRRRDLHAQCGAWVLATRPEEGRGEAALHFHHAGDDRQAYALSIRASQDAEEQGAVAEAIKFCEIARATSLDRDERVQLSYRLAKLSRRAYDLRAAIRHAQDAEEGLRLAGEKTHAAECAVLRIEAQSELRLIGHRTSVARLNELLAEFRDAQAWPSYFLTQEKKIRLFERLDDLDAARAALDEVRALMPRADKRGEAIARSVLALDLMFNDGRGAIEHAAQAVRLADELGDFELRARACLRHQYLLVFGGSLNSPIGQEMLRRCGEMGERSGDFKLRFSPLLSLGCWLMDVGDLDRAELSFRQAEGILATPTTGPEHPLLPHNLGDLAVARSDWPLAREYFKETIHAEGFGDWRPSEDATLAGLGWCELELGNLSAARDLEARIQVWTRHWYSDPTVVTMFAAELQRMRGSLEGAAAALACAAENVEGRWAAIGIKLRLAEIGYRRRFDIKGSLAIAEAVRDKATELDLTIRAGQAQAWITKLSRRP